MRHAARLQRYGSPTQKPVQYKLDLASSYLSIAEGFDRYALKSPKATQAALTLAEELLNYRATHQFTVLLEIERYMARLRAHGITARDVLIRVAQMCDYMDRRPGSIATERAENHAMARLVICLAPLRKSEKRPGAHVLNWFGPMVREACAPYAMALVRALHRDAAERRALRLSSAEL